MFLFFDTETNGLPKNYKATVTQVDNWPRIIQLAWELWIKLPDGSFKMANKQTILIKPNGWTVPTEKFWIDHGFSQEESERLGSPIEEVLKLFVRDLHECEYIVAHNMSFDALVIGAELIRAKLEQADKKYPICTMKASTEFCAIPGGSGFKWPKLVELHKKLFNADFEGAHDAGNDIAATSKCFFELLTRGIIKL